ncbi:unnamed protein product, partial [Gulo gulo]
RLVILKLRLQLFGGPTRFPRSINKGSLSTLRSSSFLFGTVQGAGKRLDTET